MSVVVNSRRLVLGLNYLTNGLALYRLDIAIKIYQLCR